MRINVETCDSDNYDEILKEYGEVLSKFGLVKTDKNGSSIRIDCLEDLFNLNKEIKNFVNSSEKSIVYFGIMVKSYDEDIPYLEIRDNYN